MASTKNTKAKTVTLDAKLVKKLEDRAVLENRNFSNMVETLLKKATDSRLRT